MKMVIGREPEEKTKEIQTMHYKGGHTVTQVGDDMVTLINKEGPVEKIRTRLPAREVERFVREPHRFEVKKGVLVEKKIKQTERGDVA